MWKNPLCGKILFMKSNLPSFVWKKSPLWKNPFYKVQFTFLCVEKSLVWKSPFYKVQFSFLGKIPCAEKSFFIKSSLPSLVSTGDRRAATQESPSVLEQRSVFFQFWRRSVFFFNFFFKRNIKSWNKLLRPTFTFQSQMQTVCCGPAPTVTNHLAGGTGEWWTNRWNTRI